MKEQNVGTQVRTWSCWFIMTFLAYLLTNLPTLHRRMRSFEPPFGTTSDSHTAIETTALSVRMSGLSIAAWNRALRGRAHAPSISSNEDGGGQKSTKANRLLGGY